MKPLSVAFALLASACAFSSAEPLFAARDAATPIRDGAQFAWIEGEASEQRSLLFRRDGRAYVVEAVGREEDRPMRAMFVPIRETRDIDVPLVARHFYHHAGWAQLMERELPGHAPLGVVGDEV